MNNKPIFVFGSNLAGRHGKGAALHALQHYGARYGVAIGHYGNSYAIPTKDKDLHPLHTEDIRHHVYCFLEYARGNTVLKFNITRIGCGLAGFSNDVIAPMFHGAPSNCWFDPEWKNFSIPQQFWEGPL